jgi:hypothetical protein
MLPVLQLCFVLQRCTTLPVCCRFRTLDMYADEGRSTAAHPPDVTYGQLVAPPSYEDSLSHASAHQHFLGGPLSQFGPPAGLHEGHDTDVQAGPSSTSEMGKGTGGAGVSAQGHSNGTAAATQAGQLQAGGTRGKEQLMAITVTDPVKRENALSIFNLKGRGGCHQQAFVRLQMQQTMPRCSSCQARS